MKVLREGHKKDGDDGGVVWALIRHDGDVDYTDVKEFAMYESDTAITEPYSTGPGGSFAQVPSVRLKRRLALVKQTTGLDI